MKESVRTNAIETRGLLISKRWVQAVAIVMLFGFFVLGLLAYRTYTDQAPIPGKVARPDGQVLFTGADVIGGQKIFLRNGLMEYGSIFGHGAYLGPDFTADYLRRWAVFVADHDRSSGSESAKGIPNCRSGNVRVAFAHPANLGRSQFAEMSLQQLLQIARFSHNNSVAFDAQKLLVTKFCQGARQRFTRCSHFRGKHALGSVEFNFNLRRADGPWALL